MCTFILTLVLSLILTTCGNPVRNKHDVEMSRTNNNLSSAPKHATVEPVIVINIPSLLRIINSQRIDSRQHSSLEDTASNNHEYPVISMFVDMASSKDKIKYIESKDKMKMEDHRLHLSLSENNVLILSNDTKTSMEVESDGEDNESTSRFPEEKQNSTQIVDHKYEVIPELRSDIIPNILNSNGEDITTATNKNDKFLKNSDNRKKVNDNYKEIYHSSSDDNTPDYLTSIMPPSKTLDTIGSEEASDPDPYNRLNETSDADMQEPKISSQTLNETEEISSKIDKQDPNANPGKEILILEDIQNDDRCKYRKQLLNQVNHSHTGTDQSMPMCPTNPKPIQEISRSNHAALTPSGDKDLIKHEPNVLKKALDKPVNFKLNDSEGKSANAATFPQPELFLTDPFIKTNPVSDILYPGHQRNTLPSQTYSVPQSNQYSNLDNFSLTNNAKVSYPENILSKYRQDNGLNLELNKHKTAVALTPNILVPTLLQRDFVNKNWQTPANDEMLRILCKKWSLLYKVNKPNTFCDLLLKNIN